MPYTRGRYLLDEMQEVVRRRHLKPAEISTASKPRSRRDQPRQPSAHSIGDWRWGVYRHRQAPAGPKRRPGPRGTWRSLLQWSTATKTWATPSLRVTVWVMSVPHRTCTASVVIVCRRAFCPAACAPGAAPDESGNRRRDRGLMRAGSARVRHVMIQLAWLMLHHQPDCALVRWYRERVEKANRAGKKTFIVALARKLLIALWRFVKEGVVPAGMPTPELGPRTAFKIGPAPWSLPLRCACSIVVPVFGPTVACAGNGWRGRRPPGWCCGKPAPAISTRLAQPNVPVYCLAALRQLGELRLVASFSNMATQGVTCRPTAAQKIAPTAEHFRMRRGGTLGAGGAGESA